MEGAALGRSRDLRGFRLSDIDNEGHVWAGFVGTGRGASSRRGFCLRRL